jgi:hypothetical protein
MSGNYKGVTLTGKKGLVLDKKCRVSATPFNLASLHSKALTNCANYESATTIQVTTTNRSGSCGRLGSIGSARPAYGRRSQSRKSA